LIDIDEITQEPTIPKTDLRYPLPKLRKILAVMADLAEHCLLAAEYPERGSEKSEKPKEFVTPAQSQCPFKDIAIEPHRTKN
jgi:hypothetical protein